MKRRFVTLDAMRGIAALVVVGRHFTDASGGHAAQFSYLAVDVFFLLSGFVLSLSYRRRFDAGMSAAEFMKLRVIRLYPLYFVGISLDSPSRYCTTFRAGISAHGRSRFLRQRTC